MWHNQGVDETNSPQRRSGGRRPKPPRAPRAKPPPYDAAGLERLALHYVGRFATSRGKLVDYLRRKVRERGYEGEIPPDLTAMADRFAELGYVDDKAFAEGRARSLGGRGYGHGRVRQALYAAGIDEEDAAGAHEIADDGRWAAALRYAEKKRIGPWARTEPDRDAVQKAIGVMIRAGHDFAAARVIAAAAPGVVPEDVSS